MNKPHSAGSLCPEVFTYSALKYIKARSDEHHCGYIWILRNLALSTKFYHIEMICTSVSVGTVKRHLG